MLESIDYTLSGNDILDDAIQYPVQTWDDIQMPAHIPASVSFFACMKHIYSPKSQIDRFGSSASSFSMGERFSLAISSASHLVLMQNGNEAYMNLYRRNMALEGELKGAS